jgi:hypothetical protein
MATPEDLRANADYIRMADQYVEVGKDFVSLWPVYSSFIVQGTG